MNHAQPTAATFFNSLLGLRLRRLPWIVGALVPAVGVLIAALFLVPKLASIPEWATHLSGGHTEKPLIAVLPFDNLSSEPNSGYFADGLSEEILDALSRSGVVRVAARASSFQFRGARKADAASLGADYILDGAIRREGSHVRVTAQLSDARHGVAVWAQTYDSDLSQVLELENDVANQIAHALKVVLVSPSGDTGAQTIDPAVYELYLRGRDALELADDSHSQLFQALTFFQQVVERAPGFSKGWSALASAQRDVSSDNTFLGGPPATRAEAAASAARALELDPKNADAYIVLANLTVDWEKILGLLDKALEVAPDDPRALSEHGAFLSWGGYERAAMAELRRAYELDPLSPRIVRHYVVALDASGQGAEARRVLDESFKRIPMYFPLWRRKLYFRLFDGRYSDVDQMLAPGTLRPDAYGEDYLRRDRLLVKAYRTRDPADIDAAFKDFPEMIRIDKSDVSNFVWKLALLGRTDQSFAVAEQNYPSARGPLKDNDLQSDDPTYDLRLYLIPQLNAFRRDPRFMRLAVPDGQLDYWVKSGKWPDFCSEPDLGYDCRTEAEKLTAARHG